MRCRAFLFCTLSVLTSMAPACAQTAMPDGYPELMRAAALLKSSRLFPKAEAADAGLPVQRLALEDRPVKDALQLLRRGLSREAITLPPTELEPPFPDLASFRRLARLLRTDEYVLFADGHVHDALLDARACVRLGRVAQGDTLLHGLVGIAISSTGIREVADHLDQLDEKDCVLLQQICLEWLAQPNPFIHIMDSERRFAARRLRAAVDVSPDPGEPALTPEQKMQLNALFESIEKRLGSLYAQAFDDLKKPCWEWKHIEVPLIREKEDANPEETAAAIVAQLIPTFNRTRDAYIREAAQIQLLACHAAVLHYRWEQHRLPASLDELGLASVSTDPFTGKPLHYERLSARRYRLTSAGPLAEAGDPNALDGRKPISLDD